MLEIDWSFQPKNYNPKFKKLKGKTVLEKAIRWEFLQEAIENSSGYLAGRHGIRDGSYRHIKSFLEDFARQVGRNTLAGHYINPMLVGQTAYKFDALGKIIDVFEIDEPVVQTELLEQTLKLLRMKFPNCIKGQFPDLCLSSIKWKISEAVLMITQKRHPDSNFIRPTS